MLRLTEVAGLALLVSSVQAASPRSKLWMDWPLLEESELTAREEMKGYDVSKPYPGSSSSSWEVFAEAREVRIEDLSTFNPDTDTPGAKIMERAGFRPTGDLLNDDGSSRADESWGYCYSILGLRVHNFPADAEVKPNCEGIFSDECYEWLQDFTKSGKLCAARSPSKLYYPWEDSPCKDEAWERTDGYRPQMWPVGSSNMSEVDSMGRGYIYIAEPKDENWEQTKDTVWMVNVGWMAEKDVYANAFARAGTDLPPGSMTCLRVGSKKKTSSGAQGNDDDDGEDEMSGENGQDGDSAGSSIVSRGDVSGSIIAGSVMLALVI